MESSPRDRGVSSTRTEDPHSSQTLCVRCKQLEEQLREAQLSRQSAQAKAGASEDQRQKEIFEAEANCKKLADELKQSQQRELELKHDTAASNAQVTELEGVVRRTREEARALQDEVKALNSKETAHGLEEEARALKKELTDRQSEVSAGKQLYAELQGRLASLEEENSTLREASKGSKSSIEEGTQARLQQALEEIEALRTERGEMMQQQARIEGELATASEELEQLKNEISEVEMIRESERQALQQVEDCKEENAALTERLNTAEGDSAEMEFLQNSVRELERCNRQALGEMLKLENEAAELEIHRQRAEQASDLEQQLEDARAEIERLMSEVQREGTLRRKTVEMDRRHIGELESKLSRAHEDLRAALLGAEPGATAHAGQQQSGSRTNVKLTGASGMMALKEAAQDIRSNLRRVEEMKKEAGSADAASNEEVQRQVQSLNDEINRQHKFAAQIASELKQAKEKIAMQEKENRSYLQKIQELETSNKTLSAQYQQMKGGQAPTESRHFGQMIPKSKPLTNRRM